MSERKVMFFDIDGTLLPSGAKEITKSALEKIKESQKKGNLMFINTGRTLFNLPPFILNAGFDGYVCACGTYILINGEKVFYKRNPDEVCRRVYEEACKCDFDIVYESWHGLYYEPDKIKLKSSLRLIRNLQKENMIIAGIEPEGFNFDKFVVFNKPEFDIKQFTDITDAWFDCIDRGNDFYEFVPKGCSKGTGIQFILDYFKLPLSCAYAIGDSTNDLPMLKYVPHSIAMGNSYPKSVFDEVEFVTKDIEDDGVAYAMEHYGF